MNNEFEFRLFTCTADLLGIPDVISTPDGTGIELAEYGFDAQGFLVRFARWPSWAKDAGRAPPSVKP